MLTDGQAEVSLGVPAAAKSLEAITNSLTSVAGKAPLAPTAS